jgi:hypothetical protein
VTESETPSEILDKIEWWIIPKEIDYDTIKKYMQLLEGTSEQSDAAHEEDNEDDGSKKKKKKKDKVVKTKKTPKKSKEAEVLLPATKPSIKEMLNALGEEVTKKKAREVKKRAKKKQMEKIWNASQRTEEEIAEDERRRAAEEERRRREEELRKDEPIEFVLYRKPRPPKEPEPTKEPEPEEPKVVKVRRKLTKNREDEGSDGELVSLLLLDWI